MYTYIYTLYIYMCIYMYICIYVHACTYTYTPVHTQDSFALSLFAIFQTPWRSVAFRPTARHHPQHQHFKDAIQADGAPVLACGSRTFSHRPLVWCKHTVDTSQAVCPCCGPLGYSVWAWSMQTAALSELWAGGACSATDTRKDCLAHGLPTMVI